MDEELKKLIENTAAETRRHFDVVADRLESKIEAVAEGVTAVNELIDRFAATMKDEIADIRSKIEFSHAKLTSHPRL